MRKAQGRDPILIYQMGKVGSTSIARALTKQGLPVVQLHHLNRKRRSAVKAHYEERGLRVPPHIHDAQRVWTEFVEKGKPLQVITAVREPIARNISAYFENLNIFREQKKVLEGKSDDAEIEKMINEFLKKYDHTIPLRWFDAEIKEVFGLDVYAYPLSIPQVLGYQIIRKNEISLLILRAETPDKTKVAALQEFLDIPQFPLVSKNVAAQKSYKDYYHAFTQRICLPEEYIDRMYDSQYARHFYTLEEINRFRERWTRNHRDREKPQEHETMMKLISRASKTYSPSRLGETPILVHQMGKVGSSSVVEALTRQGLPVVQLHALNKKSLAVVQAQYEERGLSLPAHIHDSQRVWAEFIDQGKSVQVITAVRDPIARNISAFFQNLDIFREQKKVLKGKSDAAEIEKMIDEFLERYDHNLPLRWFDTQMKEVFGVDVFEYPFPKTLGTQIIREKAVSILILRAETPDRVKVDAIQRFLDIPALTLEPRNVAAEKSYKDYYSAFVQRICLPEEYIERMYESQYAQHFYTSEEIRKFRARWDRGSLETVTAKQDATGTTLESHTSKHSVTTDWRSIDELVKSDAFYKR